MVSLPLNKSSNIVIKTVKIEISGVYIRLCLVPAECHQEVNGFIHNLRDAVDLCQASKVFVQLMKQ